MGAVSSVYQMFFGQKQIQSQEEVQSLKNKLRKQKSSTDAATAEQVAQLEAEITNEWREKSEKMLKAAEDKHNRALQEVEAEKLQAQQNVKDLEKKVQGLKSTNSEADQRLTSLQARVEEMEPWKDKYESLRAQAGVMKERYETRIQELEESVEEAKQKAAIAAKTTTTAQTGGQQDVAGEVKKIMSSVYHSLRGEFEADGTYTGTQALALILNTIKSETLKMTTESKDEESEEESEDEEEESEDEAERKPVAVETITEKKQVVEETIAAETQSSSQGASPSKAGHKDKPAEKKEERSMADVEADILSQLVGSGAVVSEEKSDSPKKNTEPVIEGEVEPVIRASTGSITGDKGNKYYSEELDKTKGKEEIKEVVEPKITSSKDAITGDKGNKYYTEELDKEKQSTPDKNKGTAKKDKTDIDSADAGFTTAELEAMLYGSSSPSKNKPKKTENVVAKEEKVVVEEPLLSASTTGSSTGGNPYHAQKLDNSDKKQIQPEVIEPMIASSTASANLGAKPKTPKAESKPNKKNTEKKAVVEPKVEKSKDKITGDKGNKYYSETLDKSKAPVIEPVVSKSHDHPTGDKGNPYYRDQLRGNNKEKRVVVEETMTSSSAGGLTSAPPGQGHKAAPKPIEEPMVAAKASSVTASAKPVVAPKLTKSVAQPTGDKGKKYYSEKLDASKNTGGKVAVEEAMVATSASSQSAAAPGSLNKKSPNKNNKNKKEIVVEPMISKKAGHVTGDKGNKYHTEKLDQSAGSVSKPEPVIEPLFSKSSSHPTGDRGNPYHSAKLDKSKDKPNVPALVSRDPPPLDDNSNNSLFGEDSTVVDTFGTDFKPKGEEMGKGDKKEAKKEEKKSSDKKLPSKTELLSDDSLKEKPPPLFGDDDDDDLDWLG